MTIVENFTKAYSNHAYKHTTTVRHKGTVVAFAMDDHRHIYYSVLALNEASDEQKSPLDVNYWSENPKILNFSNEIVQVGYGVVDPVLMPTVKKGSRIEADPETLNDNEIDNFLSSTARLTEQSPFQVLSDGQYIYLFRQSINTDHDDIVYAKHPDGSAVLDINSNKVPLVNDTLLVDRFMLSGSDLQRKRDVRYQRSRNKYRPHSNKDSLGAVDMEGKPFFKPTQELDFIRHLQHGRFSVLMVPTQVADIRCWQIFCHNSKTGQVDSFNIERSQDGLFNTKGTTFYTSPNKKYEKSVFERKPGKCPFTNNDLIPFVKTSGYAGQALKFNRDQYVDCCNDVSLDCRAITIEAWI